MTHVKTGDIIISKDENNTRINSALAKKGLGTRKSIDALIDKKAVLVNGKIALLGQKLIAGDIVTFTNALQKMASKYVYFAFYKPRNIVTTGAQNNERAIKDIVNFGGPDGKSLSVFPIGRLDKDSEGLIIMTNDGRITDRMLSPEYDHEKEYIVTLTKPHNEKFLKKMASGIAIGDYVTKPCTVQAKNNKSFSIILTEGKNRQIRKMVSSLDESVETLKRIRVMNIELGNLKSGGYSKITGKELSDFLKSLGL